MPALAVPWQLLCCCSCSDAVLTSTESHFNQLRLCSGAVTCSPVPVFLAVIAPATLYVVNYPRGLHTCFTVTSSACPAGVQENIRQEWLSVRPPMLGPPGVSAPPQILHLSAASDEFHIPVGQFIVNCAVIHSHLSICALFKTMFPQ